MQKPLDMEAGKQIIDAISRLANLTGGAEADSKIITLDKNAEAEKAGLREYIKNQLLEHAGHLMGCWFAVKNEYEPLCNSFASIINRAEGIRAQRKAADAALTADEKPPIPGVK
jgi:hypothetical protein